MQDLIEENMGLVVSVVESFRPQSSQERDTFIQAGRIGLWKALKKYDASATSTFTILNTIPLPSGSSLELPKIVLQTSDKIQAQSDNSSGHLTVALQMLTDVS